MTVDLSAARALCDAATCGPWTQPESPRLRGSIDAIVDGRECQVATVDGQAAMFDMRQSADAIMHANANFIAAARTLVPALIAEVERLTRERKTFENERDEAFAHIKEMKRSAGWVEPQGAKAFIEAADLCIAGLAAAGDRLSAEHELWRPVVEFAKCWRKGFRGDKATELCNAIDALLDAEAKK